MTTNRESVWPPESNCQTADGRSKEPVNGVNTLLPKPDSLGQLSVSGDPQASEIREEKHSSAERGQ